MGIEFTYRVRLKETYQPLMEKLNQFVGMPNTEATRAAIESVLDRWNLVYNDNVTIEDLNFYE
jgi:hypothetical protein